MNSDIDDDDIVALEPPLGPRLSSVVASRSPSPVNDFFNHSTFENVLNGHNNETYHHRAECHSPDGYDSDRIDPDLEELLYTSIHHQTIDTMELSFDPAKRYEDEQPVQKFTKSPEKIPDLSVAAIVPVEPTTLIQQKDSCYAIFNNRKVVKKDLKRLKKAKDKAIIAAAAASQFKIEQDQKLDLSFSNLVGADNKAIQQPTLNREEAMIKFYNEDSYDSDEERAKMKRMPSDRRFWKVGQEDLLANFGRRSGTSIRGRAKQCRQCGGYGHLVKECPRKLICYICGDTRHVGQKCRLRVCGICFEPGHLSHKCPVRYDLKEITCDICRQLGHTEEQCTLNWRKFLNITDEDTYHQMKGAKVIKNDPVEVGERVSCFNCGESGKHFACECPSKTMDNMRFQIPPPVANWRAIRKEQASGKRPTPKAASRKSLPARSTPITSTATRAGPSTSTPSVSSKSPLQNGYSKTPTKQSAPKGKKRSIPDVIQLDDSSDDNFAPGESTCVDSDDSVEYVLDLLKKSTQINDSPMSTRKSGGKKAKNCHSTLNISSVSAGSKNKRPRPPLHIRRQMTSKGPTGNSTKSKKKSSTTPMPSFIPVKGYMPKNKDKSKAINFKKGWKKRKANK